MALILDALSVITIASCFIQKLPQIWKIFQLKEAQGISLLSLWLELVSYTIMMSYNYSRNYALLTYMEYPVLLLQEYVLIYLVLKYNNLLRKEHLAGAAAYATCLLLTYTHSIPTIFFAIFVPLCTPIGASSKILQLVAILRTKNSSSVSLITWSLSAFTNLTRIVTIYEDSKDVMLLCNFVISFSLSFSVFMAAFLYKKQKVKH